VVQGKGAQDSAKLLQFQRYSHKSDDTFNAVLSDTIYLKTVLKRCNFNAIVANLMKHSMLYHQTRYIGFTEVVDFWRRLCCTFSTGCPTNVTIISLTGNQTISGQTVFQCTSIGGFPDVSYQWLNGSSAMQTGQNYAVQAPGNLYLVCVATATTGRDTCSINQTMNVIALGK
jgi:hypothetical protein